MIKKNNKNLIKTIPLIFIGILSLETLYFLINKILEFKNNNYLIYLLIFSIILIFTLNIANLYQFIIFKFIKIEKYLKKKFLNNNIDLLSIIFTLIFISSSFFFNNYSITSKDFYTDGLGIYYLINRILIVLAFFIAINSLGFHYYFFFLQTNKDKKKEVLKKTVLFSIIGFVLFSILGFFIGLLGFLNFYFILFIISFFILISSKSNQLLYGLISYKKIAFDNLVEKNINNFLNLTIIVIYCSFIFFEGIIPKAFD